MKVSEILKQDKITISFEVFPPKKQEGMQNVLEAAEAIAALKPDFMSVTYGAAGSSSRMTVEVATDLMETQGVTVIPHMTCVCSDRAFIHSQLDLLKEKGIENIMALRGDVPEGGRSSEDYLHASDLIREIRSRSDLCIGAACYPEGHVESANRRTDIDYLKEKVDAGVDFLTTQMFFDNDVFYNFLYRAREAGINVPILPGIMPITAPKQLGKAVALAGTHVPFRFSAIVDRFSDQPDALKQAGIIYASEQIIDLIANNIRHIHVYSMNKPEVAAGILANISAIIK